MNNVPLYHWHLLLHVYVQCMLQFSQFVLILYLLVLDPLVDSLVTCQKLTSLELRDVTPSLWSLLTVVKQLHNLRALRLEGVSDERVSG